MLTTLKLILVKYDLFFKLIKMDFRKRYFGTVLGATWSILNPVLTISLIFIVFKFGLKTTNVGEISFFNWLVTGMLSWFYFSEALTNSCQAFTDNSYLITKIKFPIQILPSIKIISPLITHGFLLFCFLIIISVNDVNVSYTHWPQLIYYIFCSFTLLLGFGFMASSATVFIRDISNIVSVCLQFLYWLTPIFWSPTLLPEGVSKYLKFNPLYYIVEGYRDSVFGGIPFWTKVDQTVYFWGVTMINLGIGVYIFRKLKPHFSDVI